MKALEKVIRKKYLTCTENLKKKDLVTGDEYDVVRGCNLNELLQIESTPSILEQICEGEKWHTAEYYEQQEKKYHIQVAKIYRKVKVKPTLPRIVEVEVAVPGPAIDHTPEGAAIPTPHEPTDAIRESRGVEPSGLPRDPYQMVEAPQPEQPFVLPAHDDHFGSKDADGARDFLELCTGSNLPPMTLAESSTQQLLLEELGIPARPLNNNFQEIDLRGIGMPFEVPLETSTPFVEAGARRTEQLTHSEQDGMPLPTNGDQMLSQRREEAPTVAMPALNVEPNAATTEAMAPGETPDAGAAVTGEQLPQRPATVQADQNGGAVAPERRSSSSVSPVEIVPRHPRRRPADDFTRRLPPLEDVLPRPRRSFDIFSYHHPSNLYPMIEYVQSLLFQQQPDEPHPQLLVDSSLMMRAADGRSAARDPSTLHESNERASRDPFVTPAAETSNSRNVEPPIELMQLPDQMQQSGIATSVPLVTTLASVDGPMMETLDYLRLPSLVPNATNANEVNPATDPLIGPATHGQRAGGGAGVGMETVTPQDGQLPGPDFNMQLLNPENIDDLAERNTASGRIDTMLLDILILVQGEMCQHHATDGCFVSVVRLKELFRIKARTELAKLLKNIILLKQARLLDVSCAADNSVEGVSIQFSSIFG